MVISTRRGAPRRRRARSGTRAPLAWLFAAAVVTSALIAPAATASPVHFICGANEYENVDHVCVPRPELAPTAPEGATARCKDGTYSFSRHRTGTCSKHGGVAEWLAQLP
jgi:hypothetical protein